MLTIQELILKVKDFASQISSNPLIAMEHNPDAQANPLACFGNVMAKVEREGGECVYGWIFGYHKSEFGEYLTATHHAVWVDSNDTPLDITPFADAQHNYIIKVNNNRVVFVADELAEFVEINIKSNENVSGREIIIRAPLPMKYFPITNNQELKEYIKKEVEKEQQHCEEIYKGNFTFDKITNVLPFS